MERVGDMRNKRKRLYYDRRYDTDIKKRIIGEERVVCVEEITWHGIFQIFFLTLYCGERKYLKSCSDAKSSKQLILSLSRLVTWSSKQTCYLSLSTVMTRNLVNIFLCLNQGTDGKISKPEFESLWKEFFVSNDANSRGNFLFGLPPQWITHGNSATLALSDV